MRIIDTKQVPQGIVLTAELPTGTQCRILIQSPELTFAYVGNGGGVKQATEFVAWLQEGAKQ